MSLTKEQIEMLIHTSMCESCYKQRECHENCERCDSFEDELERMTYEASRN